MRYFMIKVEGMEGWIGYSYEGPVNGIVDFISPLGSDNMTGTDKYSINDLVEITEEEYKTISEPQISWIIEDKNTEAEYGKQLEIVMKRYGLNY